MSSAVMTACRRRLMGSDCINHASSRVPVDRLSLDDGKRENACSVACLVSSDAGLNVIGTSD